MKKHSPFLLPALAFLFLKLTSLGIRFSDTNIYFYTAYKVLQGRVLYRDIFFTNFPLFIYISSLYQLLSGGNIYFYYYTASLEVVGAAFLIYLVVLDKTKRALIATLSSTMYLFSYLLLSTSDHQTGVFLASLFAMLSYYFFEKKNYLLTGVFLACTILTKAYFLPLFIAYLVCFPFSKQLKNNPVLKFILGGVAATTIVLLPSIVLAFPAFYRDIITYSLTRPQGVSKALIFNALVTREFFLLSLAVTSIFFFKKYRFFSAFSIFVAIFFLFYKDFYFYYFNIIAPFLCVFFGLLYAYVEKKFTLQHAVIPTVLVIIIGINLVQYFATTRNQTITQFPQIIQTVKQLHPPVLYGTNDITPLLAYETQTPLLNGIVDTNATIFRKGFLNNTTLTKDALSQHALLIGHGLDYPQFNVKQDMIDEIFDQKQMASCRLVEDFPVVTEGYENRLQLVMCK